MKPTIALLMLPAALFAPGCRCKGNDPAPSPKASATTSASASPSAPTSGIHGSFATKPFAAKGAFADVHATWVTITALDREVSCLDRKVREQDHAVQVTIPSGPNNDFFAGSFIATELKLSGTGVSAIPTDSTAIRLDKFIPDKNQHIKGELRFSYRAGSEPSAPAYDGTGPFDAIICEAEPTKPSMPAMETNSPVKGSLAGKPREFPFFHAYLRQGPNGRTTIQLKGFTRQAHCLSEEPNTPYLFGPQIGPGPKGDYFATTPMPVDWIMQVSTGESSERSLHAGDGAGVIQLESVKLGKNGVVKGRMMASTVAEDDNAYQFQVAGTFEAPLCMP